MAALLSVPPEILILILGRLGPSSLSSFGQTCKAAEAFVEPLLYRRIAWKFNGKKDPMPNHRIHSFFQAIRQRPARASYVKAATLLFGTGRWQSSQTAQLLSDYPPPPDVETLWVDVLRGGVQGRDLTRFEGGTFWSETIIGNPGALMAILLIVFPELETLVTDYTLIKQSDLPNEVMGGLLKLKRATVRNNLDSRIIKPFERPELSALFSLPRLEHLSTVFQLVDDVSVAQANLPALLSLNLTDHLSDPSALGDLLTKTHKLERFSYFLVEDTDNLAEDKNYQSVHQDTWSAFATSLGSIAGTLRILKISMDEAGTSDYPPETMDEEWVLGVSSRRGTIGSLTHLQNLTKLEMPMHILFGSHPHHINLRDLLPPSLRKFYLRDDLIYDQDWHTYVPDVVIPALRSYLLGNGAPGNEVLPLQELRLKLRTVWLIEQFGRTDIEDGLEIGEEDPLEQLVRISRQAGVRCTIHFRVLDGTYISTKHECIDRIDELVLHDPNNGTATPDGGPEGIAVGEVRYPMTRLLKRARCFESST